MQILEHSLLGMRSARHCFVAPDGVSVTLFPMVHVGEAAFYEQVYSDAFQHDVALVEGVNAPAVRRLTRAYRWMDLKSLGWVKQPTYPASSTVRAEIQNADITPEEFDLLWRKIPFRTRALIIAASSYLGVSLRWRADPEKLARRLELEDVPSRDDIMNWSSEFALLGDLIFDARNACLINSLDQFLDRPDGTPSRISIVYGAGHMPALIRHLTTRGFRLSDSAWIKVFTT